MPTETITRNGEVAHSLSAARTEKDEELRKLVFDQLERVRKLKVAVAGWFLAMAILGPTWVIVEYMSADGWPKHFSDNGMPGDWDPWILWVALVGLFIVGISALKVYFGRPTSQFDIDREIRRLESR